MAVEPHRLRGGRPTVQAYRNDPAPALRGFVPVESLRAGYVAAGQPPGEPAEVPAADEPAADEPAAYGSPAADEPAAYGTPAADAPPAFVIDPDQEWDERTTLFGDPEG
jgi:hypothetical protein